MGSTFVRWTLRVGLGGVLLLALPLFPFAVTASSVGQAAEKSDLLDINTATAEQFDVLPGIGPTTAGAIVAHREEHGPFRTVEDLLDVRGIGPAKLDQFRDLVTV